MTSKRQVVSPLERALDTAIDRERRRLTEACLEKAQADQRARHTHLSHAHAALMPAMSSNLSSSRGAVAPAPRPVPARSRSGVPAPMERVRHDFPSKGRLGLRIGAVMLGVLAIVFALWVPVSELAPTSILPSPERAGELSNASGRAADGTHELRASGDHIAREEPRADATQESESSTEGAARPPDNATDPSTRDVRRDHAGDVPVTQADAERSSRAAQATRGAQVGGTEGAGAARFTSSAAAELARTTRAERPKTATAHANRRDEVVTVDDLFGIGGDEPVPPEALDTSEFASRTPPARTGKQEGGSEPSPAEPSPRQIIRGSPY